MKYFQYWAKEELCTQVDLKAVARPSLGKVNLQLIKQTAQLNRQVEDHVDKYALLQYIGFFC